MNAAASAPASPSSRRRKIRALLAGGLVLGVGAAVTLATWNDSEFAGGSFDAGSFNLEGSVDGATFDEHASAAAAAPLSFEVDASNLSPGDSVTAPFAVRLDDATTYGAGVDVQPAATTGTVSGLTYSLTTTDGFGCETATASTLVAAGTGLGSAVAEAGFPLSAGAEGTPGEVVNLCFSVTADGDLEQGQSGTATWEFLATSES